MQYLTAALCGEKDPFCPESDYENHGGTQPNHIRDGLESVKGEDHETDWSYNCQSGGSSHASPSSQGLEKERG